VNIDTYEEGVPSWVDVACPDPAAGRAFYSALFGWEIVEGPPESGGYAIAHKNGRTVAGVGPQMNPMAPPAWTNYVNVASADKTAEAITANGGTMFMTPMDVMDVGRMAIFADPMGAVMGLWQPNTHPGAGIVNELHTWCWSELMTTDVESSTDFYGAVFGWGTELHGDGPRTYHVWTANGRGIGGMIQKPDAVPADVPPCWTAYFTVADVDAAAKEIVALGGSIVQEPMDVEPGRIVVAADVGGATFGVIRFFEQPD
jgi:predicted enzyme related to lactoylglutathione lyase